MRRDGVAGSFWPTPTQEALFRLVLGRDEHVEARWRALQPLDIDRLEPGSFCLLPLLHSRLAAAGVDDPLAARIAGTYRSTWYRNQIALERLKTAVEALDAAGLPVLVFGGASLAARWYAQLGHRPVTQLDLAVPPDETDRARDVLRAASWHPQQQRSALVRLVNRDMMVLVLHRGVPRYVAGRLGTAGALALLRSRGETAEIGGARMVVLPAAAELVVTCGLGARRAVPPSVQWLLDAAAILRAEGAACDEIVAEARSLELISAVRETVSYLSQVAETLEVADVLAEVTAAGEGRRARVAYRLAGGVGGRFQPLAQGLGEYLRASAAEPLPAALGRLPAHLRDAWGTSTQTETLALAVKKLRSASERRHAE